MVRGESVDAEDAARQHGWPMEISTLGTNDRLHVTVSFAAHAALGFEPTLRLQFFRKLLSPA